MMGLASCAVCTITSVRMPFSSVPGGRSAERSSGAATDCSFDIGASLQSREGLQCRTRAGPSLALATAFTGPWPDEFERAATQPIFRQVGQSDGDDAFDYRREAIRRGVHMLTSIASSDLRPSRKGSCAQ